MKTILRSTEAIQFALLFLCLGGPLGLFFFKVLSTPEVSTEALIYLLQPSILKSVLNSITVCLVTSVLSTAFAFWFSWLLWRFDWPKKFSSYLSTILKMPYLLPPFFFAMGWIALAAPSVGYLIRLAAAVGMNSTLSLYGMGGTIFVLVLWSTALAMIQIQIFFTQYPGQLEDAAILCGASPLKTFFKITIPLARPQLLSCALMTGVSALAAFGVPSMLGMPARSFVLTTRIYQEIKSSGDFTHAGLLSLVLLSITFLLLILQRTFTKSTSYALVSGKAARPAPLQSDVIAKLGIGVAAVFALTSCVLPFAALITQALAANPHYVLKQIPDGWVALQNSALTAAFAAAIATFGGLLIAYGATRLKLFTSKAIIQSWSIGYALPGTLIALSFLVFYSGTLTDTLWILGLAYVAKYAAFALRILSPAIASLSIELEEAAWMSGASPVRAFFRITAPMLRPAIAAALLLALVPMLSELTMSVLLVGAGTDTLGALIYRLQEYADPGSASVLALAVTFATLLLNFLLKRLSKGQFGI